MKNVILYYPDGKTSYHEVNQKMLDKEESLHAVKAQNAPDADHGIVSTKDSEDVDFTDEGRVSEVDDIFDAIKKKVTSKKPPKKVNGSKIKTSSKKSKKGIQPVGEEREETKPEMVDDSELDIFVRKGASDLSFVDAEQREEAIQSHPVLGKKKGDS